uniref:General transcription factor IIA, 1 n=1 Tax=Tetraodon nigroviridis TaxID=99883 RepID=H3CWE9_TETNG
MASSANSNPVPKVYKSVIDDVINEVRELFLDEGVDEQVLLELKTLWENKLLQSKAVEGFYTEEQTALQAAQQQQHQVQPVQQVAQPTQAQQVILPPQPQQQAPQQQVIVQDSKILQHMSATGMSAAATAATLALPAGVTPYQQLLTSQGQLLQVVRAANGTQYLIQQPQQQILLQQQMQPAGVQAPVIQQVLTPLPGALPQQTGVIIQPQQIVLASGNKVQGNTQVAAAAQVQQMQQASGAAAAVPKAQPQPQVQQPPLMLQVDGAGETSWQVEEEPLNSGDDVSDEEDQELFDTENVVVCQYDKIHRSKNKWKFHLKDGIMNLNGKDYVFSKAIGDAEW